MKLAKWRRCKY